jgi:hypothetical protein
MILKSKQATAAQASTLALHGRLKRALMMAKLHDASS